MARPENLKQSVPGMRRVLARFWPYIREHRALTGGSFLALFLEVGLRLLEPWPLKFVVDRVVTTPGGGSGSGVAAVDSMQPMTLLTVCAAALAVIVGLRALVNYLAVVGFALVGNQVLTRVRSDLYAHLQKLSLSYHTKARGGDLTVRVVGDIGMLKEVTVTALMPFLGNILILFGMLVVMLILNWQLALIALAVLPIFWFSTVRLGRGIQGVSRKQRQREGAMASTASESIGAIKLVQALSLENVFNKSFASENAKSLKEGVQAKRLASRLERTADVLVGVSTALVLYFGARLVMSNSITPGDLLVFLTYLKNAFKPVRDFAKYTGRIAKATAAGERVVDVMDREPDIRDKPGARTAPPFEGRISFENVRFGYEPDQPVLNGFDFEIEPGKRVALVGASGNGKSTLANLLLRLYDPGEGRVTVDGGDVRDYTLQSLRSQMGVVMQDSLLFAASVRDNIAYGAKEEVSDEEVEAAARLAGAHDFIAAMPEGYDTVLSERGASLSGGQRQRLAIARAAIREAPIMILDEPTTGLDEENERNVTGALERLTEGRTTLLITHDLELASRSDEILYLDSGRVLESGSHEDLMRRGGRYATMYDLQSREEERGAYTC